MKCLLGCKSLQEYGNIAEARKYGSKFVYRNQEGLFIPQYESVYQFSSLVRQFFYFLIPSYFKDLHR